MKFRWEIIYIIFEIFLLESVNSQDYGQIGNSAVVGINQPTYFPQGPLTNPTLSSNSLPTANTTTNTSQPTTTTLSNPTIVSECFENDSVEVCISKPTCCHVTNNYLSYAYTACVNALNANNFGRFCKNFFDLNRKEGFSASECICYGKFSYLDSNYLKLVGPGNYSLLLFLLFFYNINF